MKFVLNINRRLPTINPEYCKGLILSQPSDLDMFGGNFNFCRKVRDKREFLWRFGDIIFTRVRKDKKLWKS